MRTLRPLVAVPAALAVLVVTVVAVAPAQAQTPPPPQEKAGAIGLRLVDAPVAARDDPRAQVYIVDHLAPGKVIERRIEVSNTTASTQHVVLYGAAASIDGGSFLGAAGTTANELSTWTSVAPATSDLVSAGKRMATVTIAVPADAPPGEQYGVVWAEARSDPSAGAGVTQVSRVGIRLYISVGPGNAPAPNFTIDSLTAERSKEGRPMITGTVRNIGGRALDMTGTLQLSAGPGGLSAGPFSADLGRTLAIGDTQPVTVALDGRLPGGPWDARITLKSGMTERSAQASVTFPDAGAAAPVATNPADAGRGWRLPAVVGLALLVLATVGTSVVRRLRRRPADETF